MSQAQSSSGVQVDQYLRYVSVIVADRTGKGLELSDLTITFSVHHSSFITPHTADICIYNLSEETSQLIGTFQSGAAADSTATAGVTKTGGTYTTLIIQAGYKGNFGTIFTGTIKQIRRGRENGTDTFLRIFAADGDQWHNFAVLNGSLSAGYTQTQVWTAMGEAIKGTNSISALPENMPTARASRGRVFFGMVRDYIRDFANSNNLLVTTDNSMVSAAPLLAYKPGDAVVLNSETGLIGTPEQTELGITATCLLNPAIGWRTLIKINQADITRNLNQSQVIVQGQNVSSIFPSTAADGEYTALIVDHVGTTRGTEFYTSIVAIARDPTTPFQFGTGAEMLLQRQVGGA